MAANNSSVSTAEVILLHADDEVPTDSWCPSSNNFNTYSTETNNVDGVWIFCTIVILVGNISVLLWRCTRQSDQRNSVSSILIINLAASDLLLGIQMLLYLFLVAWPCSVFHHKAVVNIFCHLSLWLQTVSVLMSALLTVTIAVYFLVSLGCLQCSRKCIAAILVSEWMLIICGSSAVLVTPSPFEDDVYDNFDSLQCLPVFIEILLFNGPITFFLFIVAIMYIVLLIKIKQQGQRPSVSTRVAQIQLISIAFASFICWGISLPISILLSNGTYYDQYCIAAVAISNPLVFTLLSPPFIKSAKRVWECLCYKCGQSIPAEEITSDGEGREPFLTRIASQTNYSSSESRIEV
ncbi:neuropeptide Y receptor type 1-like [Oscarella lobularis]|uniref:neuropeptide Y receptor type 1-like n=1 Tax=Oscarella lobularis TaxID=121494 RepID=UPI00331347EC